MLQRQVQYLYLPETEDTYSVTCFTVLSRSRLTTPTGTGLPLHSLRLLLPGPVLR